MFRAKIALFSVLVLALSGLGSCASTRSADDAPEEEQDKAAEDAFDPANFSNLAPGESVPSVRFKRTVEANWKEAEEAFEDEDYLAAQRYYTYIRSKFPYSIYSALSAVRLGDCLFERGRFIEAIDGYQNFVRMHPKHARIPYALFRTALSYYEQIPTDWFILPPSEEKDQGAVQDAHVAFGEYLRRFPNDEHSEEARKLEKRVRERLIAHERYAADFYRKLGKDLAYVGRLEVIRTRFPEIGVDDKLLLEIAEIYSRLGHRAKLREVLAEMERRFPQSSRLSRTRKLLKK